MGRKLSGSASGEIGRVPVTGGSAQTITTQLPEPVGMLWVKGTLWVRGLDDSLQRVDPVDGSATALRSIEGLCDIQMGPNGAPVVPRQANGHSEVGSLSADDATDAAILWAQDSSEYLSSFTASPDGVLGISSTDTTDRLHFIAAGADEPVVTAVRTQSPMLSRADVIERVSAQGAIRLTPLGKWLWQ